MDPELKNKKPKKEKKEKTEKKSKKEEVLEDIDLIDFSKPKKSKKKTDGKKERKEKPDDDAAIVHERPELDPNWNDPYTYDFLLKTIEETLELKNPYKNKSKELHVKPIALEKAGRQYKWSNFVEFCNSLNRRPDHLSAYVGAEMGIHVIVAEEKMIMEGRAITQDTMQSTVRGYIHEYVICKECNGASTDLIKKPEVRMIEMFCHSCKSSRTVQAIHSATAVTQRR